MVAVIGTPTRPGAHNRHRAVAEVQDRLRIRSCSPYLERVARAPDVRFAARPSAFVEVWTSKASSTAAGTVSMRLSRHPGSAASSDESSLSRKAFLWSLTARSSVSRQASRVASRRTFIFRPIPPNRNIGPPVPAGAARADDPQPGSVRSPRDPQARLGPTGARARAPTESRNIRTLSARPGRRGPPGLATALARDRPV